MSKGSLFHKHLEQTRGTVGLMWLYCLDCLSQPPGGLRAWSVCIQICCLLHVNTSFSVSSDQRGITYHKLQRNDLCMLWLEPVDAATCLNAFFLFFSYVSWMRMKFHCAHPDRFLGGFLFPLEQSRKLHLADWDSVLLAYLWTFTLP